MEFALSALEGEGARPPLTWNVPGAGRRNRRQSEAESTVNRVRRRLVLAMAYVQSAGSTSPISTRGTDSVVHVKGVAAHRVFCEVFFDG
jgi:hypothetical protein